MDKFHKGKVKVGFCPIQEMMGDLFMKPLKNDHNIENRLEIKLWDGCFRTSL